MRVINLLFCLLFLTGCSLFESKVEHEVSYLPISCSEAPPLTPIVTTSVKPVVLEDKYGVFWIGITPNDYENLSLNLQESIRFIKEQKAVNKYYRLCITDFNKHIETLQSD